MKFYKSWAHRVFPKYPFEKFIFRTERLCRSKRLKIHLEEWIRQETSHAPDPAPTTSSSVFVEEEGEEAKEEPPWWKMAPSSVSKDILLDFTLDTEPMTRSSHDPIQPSAMEPLERFRKARLKKRNRVHDSEDEEEAQ
ncbi:hypothetical protein HMI55_002940 [Coelomomyces lativittatus]|nr:hypothetical protein HMI55_002940 [Coelomomyces lativittatus]